MTNEEAIKKLEHYRYCLKFQYGWYGKDDDEAIDMAIKALKLLDKLDEIITEQIDVSYNQVECQTLRWVLDKMAEEEEE